MDSRFEHLLARLRETEDALAAELDARRARFRYRVERGRVIFEKDVRRAHREARESLLSFLSHTRPLVVLSAPLIYVLIVPLVLLDIFVSFYHAVCFPIYGIEKVRRRDYVALDRHHLQYLNALQKLNCVYCGYANGLIAYVREVAGRTEQFWCPIKHARRLDDMHPHYPEFVDFGDAEGFQKRVEKLRAEHDAIRADRR